MRRLWLGLVLCWLTGIGGAFAQASGQDLTALARLTEAPVLEDRHDGLSLQMSLTQPVPWRVYTLDAPPRLVLDFSELDFTGADRATMADAVTGVATVNHGLWRPGWTRMVLELAAPMVVDQAGMTTAGAGAAILQIDLTAVSAEVFAARAGAPASAVFADETGLDLPAARTRQTGDRPLKVVLDPGHGGIDPGAEAEGVVEAHLVLTFAHELRELLLRTGGFDVVLTREDDRFVPLETRVTIARHAGADVFLSLHADALAQGRATGATVYTLSEDASDIASQKLAERHDRSDLLAGVDLSRHDDEVALVLMDMARRETTPRSLALAAALVQGIHSSTQSTYKTPQLQAGFSVLKAPDIPSALIELGFLTSKADREKLVDPAWRAKAAEGIRDALQYWAIQDAAEAVRLRQ
ncbi:N-acetylmuramoyl-L-alanine amidase [Aliiroseovarius sp.]|uniref:N-acetylmuramoyl-L-alanine amidase n=1 Tax=Aliiroseovarius sp. TaxID=1872442 RepID=UPI003BADA1E4